jgi:putative glutamine amidotransferase
VTVRDANRPRIALTAAIIHEDPARALFKGKALQFSEQKMAHAVWRGGGLPIQLLDLREREALEQSLAVCDGLLLQGGADVAPVSYGEQPLRPEWSGDLVRDQHELAAIEVALALGKPILGICRGIQMFNVALGGSLFQDIGHQVADSLVHRDWDRYEVIEHEVTIERESWLGSVFQDHARLGSDGAQTRVLTNSIHHQAVNRVADSLAVSARAPDGVIEALELVSDDRWVVGVQWHPEWLDGSAEGGPHRTSGNPLFSSFVEVCRARAGRS